MADGIPKPTVFAAPVMTERDCARDLADRVREALCTELDPRLREWLLKLLAGDSRTNQ